MNNTKSNLRSTLLATAATAMLAGLSLNPPAAHAGEAVALVPPVPAPAAPAGPAPLTLENLGIVGPDASPFLRDTRFLIDGRLRYEYADQDGRKSSNALTWRNRLGLETGRLFGFAALAELEYTWAILGAGVNYNPYPRPGRTVIADPENFELNRLQLSWKHEPWGTEIIGGRQRIRLDDLRYVGAVNWRQNQQTFDAARLEATPIENITLNYAYVWQVNRIFGEDAPSSILTRFKSDSHLINLRFDNIPGGTLTAYGYILDIEDAEKFSSQTYGIRYNGSVPMGDPWAFVYDAQGAFQTDYRNNPKSYTAPYAHIQLSAKNNDNGFQGGIAYELLGSDNNAGFQTPLGTNHKFNGFADAFLVTPDKGLQDFYAWLGTKLPWALNSKLIYHHFRAASGSDNLGNEIDFTLGRKLGPRASILGVLAFLNGQGPQPDITRASVQVDYKF